MSYYKYKLIKYSYKNSIPYIHKHHIAHKYLGWDIAHHT